MAFFRIADVLWFIPDPGIDFASFYASAVEWLHGRNPYPLVGIDPPNLTPPVMLLVFAPLTQLPLVAARAVWSALSLACIVTSVWLGGRDTGMRSRDVLVIVLAASPIALALGLAQVSCLLMVLMTLAWIAIRGGRPATGGAWLGAICLLKPFYGLFLLWLLWKREWRAAATLLAVVLAGVLVSALVVGADGMLNWVTLMRQITWQAHLYNASIHGVGARLLAPARELPAATWTPVLVSSGARVVLEVVLTLLVSVVAIRAVRRVGPDEFGPATHGVDTAFAALSAAGVLLSPLAWVHYVPVSALPTIAVFARRPVWWGFCGLALALFPYPMFINRHYALLGTLTVGQWSFSLAATILMAAASRRELRDT